MGSYLDPRRKGDRRKESYVCWIKIQMSHTSLVRGWACQRGHRLAHNLMSIARDAGVITEAQQKELDALFTDKDGKFDEEAFAEAFARELNRAFHETVDKRMQDVPPTKAGRALRRVADFIVTLARSFAFWRQERGLDPVTGRPLQAGQVLDAFLKQARAEVDEATRIANAARAAETRAMLEAMANAPTQTVVDEDGTEVAYHERGQVSAEELERVRAEMDEVRRQYEGTEQWMKAPNGRPTKLNERQWLQVRTPSFKVWFGDWEHDPANASKVVDENGEPRVVYHGTTRDGFWAFDAGRTGENYNGFSTYAGGFYFTPNRMDAHEWAFHGYYDALNTAAHLGHHEPEPPDSSTERLIATFLNIRNPARMDSVYTMEGRFRVHKTMAELQAEGFDGVISEENTGEIVAFVPEQIKSATDNVGTFDPDNVDIRYHTAGMDFGGGMFYVDYKDDISNTTCLSALRLAGGNNSYIDSTSIERSPELRRSRQNVSTVVVPFGVTTTYNNGVRDYTSVGGSGFIHLVDERLANEYDELYGKDKDEALKMAIRDALRVIEAIRRGEIVKTEGTRFINRIRIEHTNDSDFKTYCAILYWDRNKKTFSLITGFKKDSSLAKTQVDARTGKSSVVHRRSEFQTSEYYGHLKRKLPELTR